MDARLNAMYSAAHTWIGSLIAPARWEDQWLRVGLVGYMVEAWVLETLGDDEALYRRFTQNQVGMC